MRECCSASTCRRRSLRGAALVAAVLGVAAAVGCASAIPHATTTQADWASAQWPGTTTESLADARSLYVAKCAGCHSLYPPQRVVSGDFPANLEEMAARAELDDTQRELITRYLLTVTH